jgi:hypothetical protein
MRPKGRGRGGFNQPNKQPIDPNTNYRLYYAFDPKFYIQVLEAEEPGQFGHEFKMHLFNRNEEKEIFDEQFELQLSSFLSDMGAENFKFGRESEIKMRVNFYVNDKQKAIDIYKYFIDKELTILEAKANIYLQKPEEIFVKYGDIAAEEYYKKEQERKE